MPTWRSEGLPLKRRGAWFESQLDLDPERLVFVDETWIQLTWPGFAAAPRKVSGSELASDTLEPIAWPPAGALA